MGYPVGDGCVELLKDVFPWVTDKMLREESVVLCVDGFRTLAVNWSIS